MALKTFNLDEETYKKYSAHCKENGISMSKQVEKFITSEIEKISKQVSEPKENKLNSNHNMQKYC